MAMRMNHCTECQKHFFLHENACPHCGAALAGGRMSRFVRQARMGGLMLFTALTTTACYGSPAVVNVPHGDGGVTNQEPIEKKAPTELNRAYQFVTPTQYARESGRSFQLDKAVITGNTLTLTGDGGQFKLIVEVASPEAFAAKAGVRDAINVEQMVKLEAEGSYFDLNGNPRLITMKAPGSPAVTGVLQLSRVDETAIGGTLLLNADNRSYQLYFLAAR